MRVMVLHMTDFCNLKCKYCFIEGGQASNYCRQSMSIDTARVAVNKYFQILKKHNIHKSPSIVFYGGEPLLNWNVIKFAISHIHANEVASGIKVDKVIITNGTILTDEIIDYVKQLIKEKN